MFFMLDHVNYPLTTIKALFLAIPEKIYLALKIENVHKLSGFSLLKTNQIARAITSQQNIKS